ncbi:MAG: 1-acyl-sn-glycerol-3-phosphate acyltransferase [Kofleriaceae bacterium]|nr:1-acyl-sn-glycerol-3-phosphate acyltransferase [Kofleriaceae bacterium]
MMAKASAVPGAVNAVGSDAHLIVTGKEGMYSEPAHTKWGRRLVSIPALILITTLYGVALVPLIPYSIVRDLLRRRPLLLLRFHVYIFSVLFVHLVGLTQLGIAWFYGLPQSPARKRQIALKVELWFIPRCIALAEKIYGMEIILDDIECCAPGPILLLSRHASILDTILPIKILGEAHGMGMRIVQKDILRWNALVEVASHRSPRAFIKRGSNNVEREIGHMKHLLEGIGPGDALVLFPEGSRFTPEKKKRIVSKLEKNNPIAAARAQSLSSVLPVRPAGTIALMDARPDIDIVFLAHTGLEGANGLNDFVRGALYKRKLRMKFWRVPASDVPKNKEERLEWLHNEWTKVDKWITANRQD